MSDCQQQPARVPSARKSCAATLHKHELFIHGGRGKGDVVLADAAIFDLKTPRWSVLPSGRGKLQDAEQTNEVRQRAGSQFMSLLHLLQPLIVQTVHHFRMMLTYRAKILVNCQRQHVTAQLC